MGKETEAPEVFIQRVLTDRSIDIHFQPIVNIREESIVGVEALARARDPKTGDGIPPALLFNLAHRAGEALALDRLCRATATQRFSTLENSERYMLFLNIDASILTEETVGSGKIEATIVENGIDPRWVVLEIVEAAVASPTLLRRFSTRHREDLFLLAVDDFGSDHSNLDRLLVMRPDVLKLDRAIVNGMAGDHFKRTFAKTAIDMARSIGALSLVEGVESLEDLVCASQLGADLFQGFLFSGPIDDYDQAVPDLETKLRGIMSHVSAEVDRLGASHQERRREIAATAAVLRKLFEARGAVEVGELSQTMLERHADLECIYLLDPDGTQISPTYFRDGSKGVRPQRIFQPAPLGSRHHLKHYHQGLVHGDADEYLTEPYLSLASGRLCRTHVSFMRPDSGERVILCLDFQEEPENEA